MVTTVVKRSLFLQCLSGKWNTDGNIEDFAFDETALKAEIATVCINHIKSEKKSHVLKILSESASILEAENSVALVIKCFHALGRKSKDAKISNADNELKIINFRVRAVLLKLAQHDTMCDVVCTK